MKGDADVRLVALLFARRWRLWQKDSTSVNPCDDTALCDKIANLVDVLRAHGHDVDGLVQTVRVTDEPHS